ncbi:CRISPR-associated endonuclease Cas1 [Rhodovastum atsumiense]|uniref:CRISPR-associated endonuclease Cas1 n=1 Tax=Rhodovastum atsumiense TaxID=504468 RepID=A0A5M6INJ5_9PROT|nr:type I-E CRISPR-associated endonuclease Cas1e [Rhodovastum atsumiense]KAA5609830.1 type I-E CRISPR-associated endonuclease Cas1 [Rhodovastum atsumiense]CAH2603743.1 CRISPR-associated endonuclease Cas1 [Rhodovastum atsumiense]
MLKGRLGLETARVPHADRHGLIWLARGNLFVEDGTLRFRTAGGGDLDAGDYAIPYQMLSLIVLGPGSTVSHDALRLMARHGTGLVASGDDGVRAYTAMPLGPDDSRLARRQARVWADADGARIAIARRLYAWRLGEILPHRDLDVLRGIEGARMKETYRLQAEKFNIPWHGRRYDRANPSAADLPNQAINHAATAVEAAAFIAVAATATLAPLGFIHEDSANAFVLDIADLFRDSVTLPLAFGVARKALRDPNTNLERELRGVAGRMFRDEQVIPRMIDRIKELFDADDADRNA